MKLTRAHGCGSVYTRGHLSELLKSSMWTGDCLDHSCYKAWYVRFWLTRDDDNPSMVGKPRHNFIGDPTRPFRISSGSIHRKDAANRVYH
jgi:hypothetical protein